MIYNHFWTSLDKVRKKLFWHFPSQNRRDNPVMTWAVNKNKIISKQLSQNWAEMAWSYIRIKTGSHHHLTFLVERNNSWSYKDKSQKWMFSLRSGWFEKPHPTYRWFHFYKMQCRTDIRMFDQIIINIQEIGGFL